MQELTNKEMLIAEEYLSNGFKKQTAYKVYYPSQTKGSNNRESYKFFAKEHIKNYIEQKIESNIINSKALSNKILSSLDYDSFEREIDEQFNYSNKQKAQEMLMKMIKQNRVLDGDTNIQQQVIFLEDL